MVTNSKVYIWQIFWFITEKMRPLETELSDLGLETGLRVHGYMSGRTMSYHLGDLMQTKIPRVAKEHLMIMNQIYYNFLVKEGATPERMGTFCQLNWAGKAIVGNFYRNRRGLSEIADLVKPISPELGETFECGAKSRHLEGTERGIFYFGKNLEEYESKFGSPDVIVNVATGAFEPAFLACDIFEGTDMLHIRYSRISLKDNSVVHPYNEDSLKELIKGGNVLVIEDVMCEGTSMDNVIDFLIRFNPKKLNGIAVRGDSAKLRKQYTPLIFEKELMNGWAIK